MRPNAAIFYHRDGFDTSREKLMGRHAAGEGFLRGYLRHAEIDRIYCHGRREDFDHFCATTQSLRREGLTVEWLPSAAMARLAEPGCLFVPAPGIAEPAWRRRLFGQRAFSLCGVTHTIASARIMDLLGELMVAPVQPWDAIICTSRAARQAIETMIEGWTGYLEARLGARATLPIQLPVIPLGVDSDRFAPVPQRQAERAEMRQRLGIPEAEIAFLFMGRLSFHAKANPVSMYRALEEAARRTGARLHLILGGRFPNASIEQAFRAGAARFCPSVNVVMVDGRTPDWDTLWAAGDVFTSLSDNIQETFGLTPLEAMAAGLPAVVSDWNGYRDTVRHGIDGFVVPTITPWPGAGETIAGRHALEVDNYDHYIGHVSQFTAVDIDAAADAYERLAREPDLRRRMGEAGRARARADFDWSVVIAAYQDLWAELARTRDTAGREIAPPVASGPALPQRPDPFSAFRFYPTAVLAEDSMLSLRDTGAADEVAALLTSPLCGFSRALMLPEAACRLVLGLVARDGPLTVASLVRSLPQGPTLQRLPVTLCWMAKIGLLRIGGAVSPDDPTASPR